VGSSPTSGALLACSHEDLNYPKKDKSNDNLQNPEISIDEKKETTRELIDSICKYQKNYVKNSLIKLSEKSSKNAKIICKYIITEQNEINMRVNQRRQILRSKIMAILIEELPTKKSR